jgi:formylmethanofuran dehydrogenase subunit E
MLTIVHPGLADVLEISAARHSHLCPRQVLGARIGLAGASALGLELPCKDKCMLVIVETDGCFADGIEAATSCAVGRRTLRVEDYGKIAATFVDVKTEQAFRIAPQLDVRQRAYEYAGDEPRHYFAQLQAYQSMPDADLLTVEPVFLKVPIEKIVSRAGVRVNCEACGEEIINERESVVNGRILCHHCAFGGYYKSSVGGDGGGSRIVFSPGGKAGSSVPLVGSTSF